MKGAGPVKGGYGPPVVRPPRRADGRGARSVGSETRSRCKSRAVTKLGFACKTALSRTTATTAAGPAATRSTSSAGPSRTAGRRPASCASLEFPRARRSAAPGRWPRSGTIPAARKALLGKMQLTWSDATTSSATLGGRFIDGRPILSFSGTIDPYGCRKFGFACKPAHSRMTV
jgi:hypothetical protein